MPQFRRLALSAAAFLLLAACAPAQERPPASDRVIVSRFAGSWYEADPAALRAELRRNLDAATDRVDQVCALVAPHAGYRFSGPVAAHAYRIVEGRPYRRVVVMGPSHHVAMPGIASVPDAAAYETPLGGLPIDRAAVATLLATRHVRALPGVNDGEHSVEMHFPYLQVALPGVPVVPVVVGQLDEASARALAADLASVIDTDTLVVASSDFTHYGPNYDYQPFTNDVPARLRALDLGAWELIAGRDLPGFLGYCGRTGATICGRDDLAVLLALLPGAAQAHLAAYDTSGRITGDFANSVSYLAAAFSGRWPPPKPALASAPAPAAAPLTAEDRAGLLKLARAALDAHFAGRDAPTPESLGLALSPAAREVRGAFVTLKENGDLRGCIGEIAPQRPLAEAVAGRAVDAAVNDHRFRPVTRDELPALHLEISALTPPRPIASADEIEVGRHGVLLRKAGTGAVFLPQVATEQGWDRDTMLSYLSRKAGLPADAWKSGARFEVFEADVFGEPEK